MLAVDRCQRIASAGSSATEVRQLMHDDLVGAGCGAVAVADATHVLYELVMNGVEHGLPCADGEIEVSWASEAPMLRISVRDSGGPGDGQLIEVQRPTPDLPRGRGLAMVAAFSERWSAERAVDTTVTAWVRVP